MARIVRLLNLQIPLPTMLPLQPILTLSAVSKYTLKNVDLEPMPMEVILLVEVECVVDVVATMVVLGVKEEVGILKMVVVAATPLVGEEGAIWHREAADSPRLPS